MTEPAGEIVPLIERLRCIDELAFLHWETFEEELMRRMRDSSFASIQTERPLILETRGGGASRSRASFSTFQEHRAPAGEELSERLCMSAKSSWRPFEIARVPVVNVSGPSEVTDDEMVLALVKQEVQRRAQRDLFILMLYYPREHVMFDRRQVEEMFKIAGIDPASPSSQLVLNALDLYREAGAPPVRYNNWPTVTLEQPALATVPGLSDVERLHLLALEASLAMVDTSRAMEMAQAGIDPEDPLLERLQKFEEGAVTLFIAQVMEDNEARNAGASKASASSTAAIEQPIQEPHIDCKGAHVDSEEGGVNSEPEAVDGNCAEFPLSVARALADAAADIGACADIPIKALQESFELLAHLHRDGEPRSGPGPEAPFERLRGFLYKALILETNRFLQVNDYELRRAIAMLRGNVEDLFPCKLRLLLTELRESESTRIMKRDRR